MIGETSSHRGRHFQGLMDPAEVIVHEVEREGVLKVLHLLAEGVGQAGKSAHPHSHCQVLPLDVAGRNVFLVRETLDDLEFRADARWWAVTSLCFSFLA